MHLSRSLSALPVLILAVSATLPAQVTGSNSGEIVRSGGRPTNFVPYTLTRTTTNVQTLANGATITRTFTVKSARDSEGRVYSEEHLPLPSNLDRHAAGGIHYSIFDPVAHTYTNWNGNTKTATVTQLPGAEAVQTREGDAIQQPQPVRASRQMTREDLGVRTIAGAEARGTRTTVVVPAGEVGNDQPFTVVTEEWVSTQYHVPLLVIHDDPRSGKRTDEVTDFQAGEPDPALFEIPDGYAVNDRNAGQPN